MKNAKLFNWNLNDIVKGFIMAVIGAIITGLYTSIQAGAFPADWTAWKPILIGGLGMGLAYLIKNFFSNSDDKFMKKETK